MGEVPVEIPEALYFLEPLIVAKAGSVVLDVTSTNTTQITSVSGAVLLILAWAVYIILVVSGVSAKKNRFYSLGIIASGIMTIMTPLVYYVWETVRLGAFKASIQDFLIVAALSTLSGGIISIGLLKLTRRAISAPARP